MLTSTRTRLLIGTIALLGAALVAEDGLAQATGSLTVTANVTPSCSVGTGTLDFGSYDPSANVNGQGSFTVQCDATTDLNISLNAGQNGNTTLRNMSLAGGTELIPYHLFSDSAREVQWGGGNGIGDSHIISVTGGSQQTVDVYGQMVGSGSRPAGEYTDIVTITVEAS